MGELRYRALLIGNSWYNDEALSHLKGPERDVPAMKEALLDTDWGLFRPSAVKVLYGRPEAELRRETGRFFSGSKPDDVLLLYFSGHGDNSSGELFLCAEDTEIQNVRATAVSASFITDQADHASAQRVVILLDCCNSGLFKSRLDFGGLRGRGRYILSSTYAAGKSPDATGGGTSPFTAHLVRALTGAAVDDDGWVRFKQIAAYVSAHVHAETGLDAGTRGHDSGDLALARRGGLLSTGARPPAHMAPPDDAPSSFRWPATPSAGRAAEVLNQWAASQFLVPRPLVRQVLKIRPAGTLRLTHVRIVEARTEKQVEKASSATLPTSRYVGPIADAVTPIDKPVDLWSNCTYKGWRRGSDSLAPCRACRNGVIHCDRCGGRGMIKSTRPVAPGDGPREPAPCTKCEGARWVDCPTCAGTGQMQKYTAGTVRRIRDEDTSYVGELRPCQRDGPFLELGSIQNLADSALPADVKRDVDVWLAGLPAEQPRNVRRTRIEVAFQHGTDVVFDDGSTTRHVLLVGEPPRVEISRRDVLAIQARTLARTARRYRLLLTLAFAVLAVAILLAWVA